MENKVYYHLPGLFEFYSFYKEFLPLYTNKRQYFYEWCSIGSIYGSLSECIWNGGRTSEAEVDPKEVLTLMNTYGISCRLTFSNSLLKEEHLQDKKCNDLCTLFNSNTNGIIIYSDVLLDYLKTKFDYYYISSTTKVLTNFNDFKKELDNVDYTYVVPDFRLNKEFKNLSNLTVTQKDKVEFLVNECCYAGCKDRKECYQNVSRLNLQEDVDEFVCKAPKGKEGYKFSRAMENPCFISIQDIMNIYAPMGFKHFKIEGRGLGSALLLEFILYYMVKPEYQIHVREEMYLDTMLDLF